MGRLRVPKQRWARATLGLSLLFAVVVTGYFVTAGAPLRGVVIGGLVLGAGYWEYRKKLQEKRVARQYEADAEEHREDGN
jgi:ABC-type Fe3+ transport system permease subunit